MGRKRWKKRKKEIREWKMYVINNAFYLFNRRGIFSEFIFILSCMKKCLCCAGFELTAQINSVTLELFIA